MTASHPQYFIVIDSISPHSNSQLLTAIHCDEPNTGFEPRLISAHFFCPLVWLAVTNKQVAGVIMFTSVQQKNADCYRDGSIDDQDTTALMQFVISLIDTLPVEVEE